MRISFGKLLLAFLIIPFVELYILLEIAKRTSALTTFGLIIVTGVIGAYFARREGQVVLSNIQRDLKQGQMPAENLLHGLCVLIGGILLLTPGILTDALGFLLVFPVSRIVFTKWLKTKFSGMIKANTVHIYSNIQNDHYQPNISEDFEVVDDDF